MANAANATANAFTRVLSACDSIMNTGGISELEKKTTQVGQQTDENTRKQEEYNQEAERRRSGLPMDSYRSWSALRLRT